MIGVVSMCNANFLFVALVFIGASLASAADWPLFRGDPLQTGIAKEELPGPLAERWKVRLGNDIESTAAIVGGTVYIGSFDQTLYALHLKTGKEKWKYKAGDFK